MKLTLVAHNDSRQQEEVTAPPAGAQRKCRQMKRRLVQMSCNHRHTNAWDRHAKAKYYMLTAG